MEIISIKNNHFLVNISKNGAEVQTIRNLMNKREILWVPNTQFWNRVSPVLFPIVGKLKDNSFNENGQNYNMFQHGFARDMEFELIQHAENFAVFELKSSLETKQKYPFDFVLKISYIIIDNSLDIHFQISNLSNEVMPFSIGAHPGFTLDKPLNQYKLVFDQTFSADQFLLENGLFNLESKPVINNSNELLLSNELIERDAVVLKYPPFYKVTLCELDNTPIVSVSSSDFHFWGFWTKPDAPFFCIEPWAGIADSINADGNLKSKEGIELLDSQQSKQFSYSIEMPL